MIYRLCGVTDWLCCVILMLREVGRWDRLEIEGDVGLVWVV